MIHLHQIQKPNHASWSFQILKVCSCMQRKYSRTVHTLFMLLRPQGVNQMGSVFQHNSIEIRCKFPESITKRMKKKDKSRKKYTITILRSFLWMVCNTESKCCSSRQSSNKKRQIYSKYCGSVHKKVPTFCSHVLNFQAGDGREKKGTWIQYCPCSGTKQSKSLKYKYLI